MYRYVISFGHPRLKFISGRCRKLLVGRQTSGVRYQPLLGKTGVHGRRGSRMRDIRVPTPDVRRLVQTRDHLRPIHPYYNIYRRFLLPMIPLPSPRTLYFFLRSLISTFSLLSSGFYFPSNKRKR